MHDINMIRENKNSFVKSMSDRQVDVDVDKIIKLDSEKRKFIFELQGLQENRNKLSRSIPSLKNDKEKINNVIEEVNKIKKNIKSKEELLQETSDNLQSILLNLPNLPSADVPVGQNESFNKVIYESKNFVKKKNWTFS